MSAAVALLFPASRCSIDILSVRFGPRLGPATSRPLPPGQSVLLPRGTSARDPPRMLRSFPALWTMPAERARCRLACDAPRLPPDQVSSRNVRRHGNSERPVVVLGYKHAASAAAACGRSKCNRCIELCLDHEGIVAVDFKRGFGPLKHGHENHLYVNYWGCVLGTFAVLEVTP